jgi:hypothetical protein
MLQATDDANYVQLAIEPSCGVLGPSAACSTQVKVTAGQEGSYRVLLRVSSASSSSSNSSSSSSSSSYLNHTSSSSCINNDNNSSSNRRSSSTAEACPKQVDVARCWQVPEHLGSTLGQVEYVQVLMTAAVPCVVLSQYR